MNVEAACIENRSQSDFLAKIGCRPGQGHFFAAAVEASEFGRLVAAHNPIKVPMRRRLPRAG